MTPAVGIFRRTRRGAVTITLRAEEHRLLRHVSAEMLELLGSRETEDPDPDPDADDDPLARALGIGTATEAPADPALARLFPDGYADDPDASADFRRYTEPGLRSGKTARLRSVLDLLGDEAGKLVLDEGAAQDWLGALNDTRLVLGARLGVGEDPEGFDAELDEDDPRRATLWVYDWLTYLQESLVQAVWDVGDLGGP